ncbi:hypothetical protein GCM10011354_27410 [Egicoccus halophilus]|uniref:Carbohydrate binding module (Family 35) n=2 Tax=Egicoccus halophilus TaxID=1670830 RepID=A0A8J3AC51_9ACTN|nr:hypothetical protein GCM10011354_27410 [Egicoccus halophilus]
MVATGFGATPPVLAQEQAPCGLDVRCEAESAVLSGGAGVASNHPGHTGSGFVDSMGAGAGIRFDVDAPAAGDYVVTIRYANGEGAIGLDFRTATLRAGETDTRVRFPVSGEWSSWQQVSVPVTLPAGSSSLDLLVGDGDDGNINVDHVVLRDRPAGSAEGTDEQGVTLRVYDVGIGLQQICTLRTGQTPNVDVLRPEINWLTPADFGGHDVNYVAQVVADLEVPETGSYDFRLVSDDGSRLSIDGTEVIDHDGLHGATPKDGSIELTAGTHAVEIDYFQAGGGAALALLWRAPGQDTFEVVPNWVLSTEGGGARVVSPGIKYCEGVDESPGDGAPLAGVHPSFDLTDLRPNDDFQPDVSGMAWFDDGSLALLTWGASQSSSNGKLYRVTDVQGEVDLDEVTVTEIASGLEEPQGVAVVEGMVYVADKTGLDRLVDGNGDGFYEGRDRLASWPHGGNFHEFAFGLPYRDGSFYVALSVALERSGDSTVPQPAADRGTVVRIDRETGELEYIAGGLRTPNGIQFGPDGALLITDNQGGWVPSSKLVRIEEGGFYNHYTTFVDPDTGETVSGRFDDQPVTPPVVWMPHNEISNSPSTPVVIEEGMFAGQLAIGDVTYGGLQRVSLDEVEGQQQGALYRMTQGLEAGVNQVDVGPDGDIYIGGIGYDGNWAQPGKLRYGLQKLTANDTVTMDVLSTEITETGFELTYTKPLSSETREELASRYRVSQWRYNASAAYGGPKIGEEQLAVTAATVGEDGRTVSLEIPGIRPGHVVHLHSPRPFTAEDGEELWSTEVWYTANVVPGYVGPADLGYYEAEEAALTGGAGVTTEHNGFSGSGFVDGFNNQGAGVTFTVQADEAGSQPVHLRYANGPHPAPGTKTVSLHVNGERVGPWALPSTGDWQTWAFATRELDLRAGENTITLRYEAGDDGNVNLDLLTLRDDRDLCAPFEPEAGYTSLFDGTLESLTAWRLAGAGAFGRVADCSLRTHGGMGLLWYTAEDFGDYSLKLDWKIPGDHNGGVFLGFPNPGDDPWVAVDHGYEIQIDPTDAPDRTTGAIYTFQGADPDAVAASINPPGAWNEYELEVTDDRIRVFLNGTLVNDFVSTDPARDLSQGFIGVQNHGGGDTVFYRNLRLAPLEEPDVTPPVTTVATAPGEPDGDDGWFTSPVTVTLEAQDEQSPVASTEYRLGDGDWTAYDEPIVLASDGVHELAYRSTDAAGNEEAIRTMTVRIDTTAPTSTVALEGPVDRGVYTGTVTVTLSATDATSGIDRIEYRRVGEDRRHVHDGPFRLEDDGDHVVEYRAIDVAGNVEAWNRVDVRIDTGPCPHPDPRANVVVGGVDSGVANHAAADGCTVNDLVDDEGSWTNHGAFVRHVDEVIRGLRADGVLTAREAAQIRNAAARSDVGRP